MHLSICCLADSPSKIADVVVSSLSLMMLFTRDAVRGGQQEDKVYPFIDQVKLTQSAD